MAQPRLRAIARHVTAAASHCAVAIAAEEHAEGGEEPVAKIELEKLHPDFGARLHNVDLEALTDEQWETIQDAFDEYGVIVIPGQGGGAGDKGGGGR
eukprot:COSAG02_NODE_567_length_20212_cov_18.927460_1_plen_97_part_00